MKIINNKILFIKDIAECNDWEIIIRNYKKYILREHEEIFKLDNSRIYQHCLLISTELKFVSLYLDADILIYFKEHLTSNKMLEKELLAIDKIIKPNRIAILTDEKTHRILDFSKLNAKEIIIHKIVDSFNTWEIKGYKSIKLHNCKPLDLSNKEKCYGYEKIRKMLWT